MTTSCRLAVEESADAPSVLGLVQEVAFVLLVVYYIIRFPARALRACAKHLKGQYFGGLATAGKASPPAPSRRPSGPMIISQYTAGPTRAIVRSEPKLSPRRLGRGVSVPLLPSVSEPYRARHPRHVGVRVATPKCAAHGASLHALQTAAAKASSGSRFYANVVIVTQQKTSKKRLDPEQSSPSSSSSTLMCNDPIKQTPSGMTRRMLRKRSLSESDLPSLLRAAEASVQRHGVVS